MKHLVIYYTLVWGLLSADVIPLEPIVVTGVADGNSSGFVSEMNLSGNTLSLLPGYKTDQKLSFLPGVSLFRRSSTKVAHPTTHGLSLRGLGPSGASRTLVTKDGIPMNDPFGGWVQWYRVPAGSLDAAHLQSGQGAGAWGHAALAGTLELSTKTHQKGGHFHLGLGNQNRQDALLIGKTSQKKFNLQYQMSRQQEKNIPILQEAQRGPVDIGASSETQGLSLRPGYRWSNEHGLSLEYENYSDDRINGTALADNKVHMQSWTLRSDHQLSDKLKLDLSLSYLKQTFQSRFSSVDATRNTERVALDQYHVPGQGTLINTQFDWYHKHNLFHTFGLDLQNRKGHTQENYRNLGAGFTRHRRAGGEQTLSGFFWKSEWDINPQWQWNAGARLNYWKEHQGKRQEDNLETNQLITDTDYPARDKWLSHFRLGTKVNWDSNQQSWLALYSGFRVPTLNELYRPFRVKNDITEANPGLKHETVYGVDLGHRIDMNRLSWSGVMYYNQLHNGIVNVLLSTTPGFDPTFGVFIPNGGSLSQRMNLDRIDVVGMENSIQVKLNSRIQVLGSALLVHARIADDGGLGLYGNELAQVPKGQFSLGLEWGTHRDDLSCLLWLKASDDQYDDSQNQRSLAGYASFNLSIQKVLSKGWALTLQMENILNHQIQNSSSSDGLIGVTGQRSGLVTIHFDF